MSPGLSPSSARQRGAVLGTGLVIVLAVLLAYANSLQGPFVYDDVPAIPENATLAGRLPRLLSPPSDTTVSGRPVLNISFALNYVVSGTAVWSYHVGNILIHAAAALALFGVVRRTMSLRSAPSVGTTEAGSATVVAGTAALLWALHPLATEGVDYIVQRAESLMALMLLLTLYAFVRAAAAVRELRQREGWLGISVVTCGLGMATKENMVAAPVLVFLFDRTFVSGSFAAAWRQRRPYYAALAATWLLLAALIVSTGGNRSGTVGFGTGVSAWSYWLTQPPALVRYLALSFWPTPLIFDYGTPWVNSLAEVAWQAVIVIALIAGTLWALFRNRPVGYLGFFAFAILAPTSLVPGTAQMIVEHRMYVSLAAVVTLAVLTAWTVCGRRALLGAAALAISLGAATAARNTTYRTEAGLWTDTAAKRPDNARAYFTLAKGLQEQGRLPEALALYEKALALYPGYLEAQNNIGNALGQLGRFAEALPHYEAAARIAPRSPVAQNNLGNALSALGRPAEAVPRYRRALELNDGYREALVNLGTALMQLGRPTEALTMFERAVSLDPSRPDAQTALANALARAGHTTAGLSHFETALRIDPANADTWALYGNALADAKRLPDAVAAYGRAAALQPQSVSIQYNYGATLLAAGRVTEAAQRFEMIVRSQPDFAPARDALAQIRALPTGQ